MSRRRANYCNANEQNDETHLLRSAQGRHESEIRLHQRLDRPKSTRHWKWNIFLLVATHLGNNLLRLVGNLGLEGILESIELFLETMNLLLKRLEQELLSKSASLGVLSVSLSSFQLLLLGEFPFTTGVAIGICLSLFRIGGSSHLRHAFHRNRLYFLVIDVIEEIIQVNVGYIGIGLVHEQRSGGA